MDFKQSLVLEELYWSDFTYSDGTECKSAYVTGNDKVHIVLVGKNSKGSDVKVRVALDPATIGHLGEAFNSAIDAIDRTYRSRVDYARQGLQG